MHKALHVYKKDMSCPCVQSEGKRDEKKKKKCSGYHCTTMNTRVPLLVSSRPNPDCESAFFCVVTALNEKNAGEPNFPPPFVSPLP